MHRRQFLVRFGAVPAAVLLAGCGKKKDADDKQKPKAGPKRGKTKVE
jgi:hypothetical protein